MNEVIAIGVDVAKNVFQVHGVDTALVDRLKALDPERPIREADIVALSSDIADRLPRQSCREPLPWPTLCHSQPIC